MDSCGRTSAAKAMHAVLCALGVMATFAGLIVSIMDIASDDEATEGDMSALRDHIPNMTLRLATRLRG